MKSCLCCYTIKCFRISPLNQTIITLFDLRCYSIIRNSRYKDSLPFYFAAQDVTDSSIDAYREALVDSVKFDLALLRPACPIFLIKVLFLESLLQAATKQSILSVGHNMPFSPSVTSSVREVLADVITGFPHAMASRAA